MTLITKNGNNENHQITIPDFDPNSINYIIPDNDINEAIKKLLEGLYKNLNETCTIVGLDAASKISKIEDAFLEEFNELPGKLKGIFSFNQAEFKGRNTEFPIDYNYEIAIVTINSTYPVELSDLEWKERKKLLENCLEKTNPSLFYRLHPKLNIDPQQYDKPKRRRRPKPSVEETAVKTISSTIILLPNLPENSPSKPSSQKFTSLEKGIETLLRRLEEKISNEIGLGGYKKVSAIFIKTFDKLPAKLIASPENSTVENHGTTFKDTLKQIKMQFSKELSEMDEAEFCELLHHCLKKTFPQYTESVFNNRPIVQDEMTLWAKRFVEVAKSKDDSLTLSTIKAWYDAIHRSPKLNSSQKLWTLFYHLAVTIPIVDETDPLSIEDEFNQGTFDIAINIFASGANADQKFIGLILSRSFNREILTSMTKYLELLQKIENLSKFHNFWTSFSKAVSELQFDEEGKYVVLQVLDKLPMSKILSDPKSLFFGVFCRIVVKLEDNEAENVSRFAPFLRSMTDKISKLPNTDIDLYIRLLSASRKSDFCDLAIDLAIPRLRALQINKKINLPERTVLQEFYVFIFAQALQNCSPDAYTKFKEKAFTNKWLGELMALNLDPSSIYLSIFTNQSLTAKLQDQADSLLRDFQSHLPSVIENGETGESIESILRSFIVRVTDMNRPDSMVVLSKRICKLIELLCNSIPSIYIYPVSNKYLSHHLFWLSLRKLGELASNSEKYNSKYLSVLFSVISTLTPTEAYLNPNCITIVFPHVVASFNKATEYFWNHQEEIEENFRLSYLSNQIIVNFFMKEFFLTAIEKTLALSDRSRDKEQAIRVCINDLEITYQHILSEQNDKVEKDLKHIVFSADEIINNIQVISTLMETFSTVRAVWTTPGMSNAVKQQAWSTLFNTYMSLVISISKYFPDPLDKTRLLYAETLKTVLPNTIATIDNNILKALKLLPTVGSFPANDLVDLYSPLNFYRDSIEKMLNSYQNTGNPSTIFGDMPIVMGLRLFRNVMSSSEEKIELVHRIFRYLADNYLSYVDDEAKINKIILMFKLATEDGIESSYFLELNTGTASDPQSQIEEMTNVISTIVESVKKYNSPGACILAVSLINQYMKDAAPKTLPIEAIIKLIQTITSTTIATDKPNIAFADVYLRLFTFFRERISDGEHIVTFLMEEDLSKDGRNHILEDINISICAFTKSLRIADHNNFKTILSQFIKGAMCFCSSVNNPEGDPKISQIQKKLNQAFIEFANMCKDFNLANNPKTNQANSWRDFIGKKIEKLKENPEETDEKLEALKAIKGIIYDVVQDVSDT